MLLAALNETNGITIETLDCLYAAALGLAAPGMRIKKKPQLGNNRELPDL